MAKKISPMTLETFKNQFPDRDYQIEITCPEFTCVCPRSGLPDFATLVIRYVPDKKCIELKSLKLFLMSFRDTGIFHENVTNLIFDRLRESLDPRRLEIVGDFNARGGIRTTVTCRHPGPE